MRTAAEIEAGAQSIIDELDQARLGRSSVFEESRLIPASEDHVHALAHMVRDLAAHIAGKLLPEKG